MTIKQDVTLTQLQSKHKTSERGSTRVVGDCGNTYQSRQTGEDSSRTSWNSDQLPNNMVKNKDNTEDLWPVARKCQQQHEDCVSARPLPGAGGGGGAAGVAPGGDAGRLLRPGNQFNINISQLMLENWFGIYSLLLFTRLNWPFLKICW